MTIYLLQEANNAYIQLHSVYALLQLSRIVTHGWSLVFDVGQQSFIIILYQQQWITRSLVIG